jgi:hypothetical protein
MTMQKRFIYAHTRLQSRHGMRPDQRTWQLVESQRDLANYLQSARQTPLQSWVTGLQSTDHHQLIEATLIQQYRDYIQDVARWIPAEWRAAVRWVARLPYLPAIHYLASGKTPYDWMMEDLELKPYISINPEQRFDLLLQSPYGPLVVAWQQGKSMVTAWLEIWQSLWPATRRSHRQPMYELIRVVTDHLAAFQQLALTATWREREKLAYTLTMMFRRYAFQPVAVFVHLLLVALDVERLRGAIVRRSVFPGYKGQTV